MPIITTKDGTQIYYKDWGSGQPIVFSHGWPLSADAWEDQMIFLASRGYRCIAHDRRGHGRSSQPWDGNEMNTYADDLATLVGELDLKNAIHIGHTRSTSDRAIKATGEAQGHRTSQQPRARNPRLRLPPRGGCIPGARLWQVRWGSDGSSHTRNRARIGRRPR